MTRVYVVADPPDRAAALAALLEGRDELVVFGASGGAAAALGGPAAGAGADVVLIDPDPERPPPPITDPPSHAAPPFRILLVDEPPAPWVLEALRAGVSGVISRSSSAASIAAAVEAVMAGLVVLAPELAGALVARRTAPRPAGAVRDGRLTPREREVLDLLAEGRGNKGIAARLGISSHTAKAHVAAVLAKLDVDTRAEAVAAGVRLGLVLI